MNSMTGYGKGVYTSEAYDITVELKSVNHRFLDLTIKYPKGFNYVEDSIRKTLQDRLSRGHIDVFVNFSDKRTGDSVLKVNNALAKQYLDSAKALNEELGIVNDMTTSTLLRMPSVSEIEEKATDEDLSQEILSALNVAIDGLIDMRASEGARIGTDFIQKLNNISEYVGDVEKRAPIVIKEYGDKLRERLQDMLSDLTVSLDESRVMTEIGIYCDKVCVDEEITRLKAHIEHFFEIMRESTAVGRKLDFLTQEINRECNTIGSKCNDGYIADKVIALKNEVEKLREQVQNIE